VAGAVRRGVSVVAENAPSQNISMAIRAAANDHRSDGADALLIQMQLISLIDHCLRQWCAWWHGLAPYWTQPRVELRYRTISTKFDVARRPTRTLPYQRCHAAKPHPDMLPSTDKCGRRALGATWPGVHVGCAARYMTGLSVLHLTS
jgi:hypothetical protein